MATETLTITSLSTLNNYLVIVGSIGSLGSKGRPVEYYYPKSSTNFAKIERLTTGPKGTIYENIYEISNHMTGGRCMIPELQVTSITDGPLGTAFTLVDFIDFCTKNTGV